MRGGNPETARSLAFLEAPLWPCVAGGRALKKSPVDFFSEGASLQGRGQTYRFRRPFFVSFFIRIVYFLSKRNILFAHELTSFGWPNKERTKIPGRVKNA